VWFDLPRGTGLDRYHSKFKAYGVNEVNFTSLQFQDYDAVGITEHAERQKLFKLIQVDIVYCRYGLRM